MFLHFLNKEQQGVLLHLAKEVMHSDGRDHELQLAQIEILSKQCENGVEERKISLEELSPIFTENKAKHSLLLELIGVALADSRWHENEKALIEKYAHKMGVSEQKVEELKNWVLKQMELYAQVVSLLD
ncbi:TerB family tellurite resistance protein [Helicobacter cetorum]|uniref:TerB family tellurite resistance protein n=1 Tax=Helicobacter cetorum TaxID=138563 RepID=UPI000CF14FD7|nr:TerB family tellurite resistance protein [Helicobacter cetorum]